jgi:PhzF family phenazine biosynthesis protein
MKIKIYQVDAFTSTLFRGNPAAVCVLKEWISEQKMQFIAAENNLAETAFVVPAGKKFEIRWFTPTTEVNLCGHATLASAHVLFKYYGIENSITFFSHLSGELYVENKQKQLVLNFPADEIVACEEPENMIKALGANPIETYKGKTDYMLVFSSQAEIENMQPDMALLKSVDCRGVIVTAKGQDVDFVSRFFGPQVGVNEDPVTGSAHTTLTPYWSRILNKKLLKAQQLSARKGELTCTFLGERVSIAGNAVTYLKGKIKI